MHRVTSHHPTALRRYAVTLVGALVIAALLGVQAAAPAPALAMTNAEDCSEPGEILFLVEPDGNCVYDGGGGSGGDTGGGNADGGGGDSADDSSGTSADDQGADSGSAAEDAGADQPDAVSSGDDSEASRIAEAEAEEKELSDEELDDQYMAELRAERFQLGELMNRCINLALSADEAQQVWAAMLYADVLTDPTESQGLTPSEREYLEREVFGSVEASNNCIETLAQVKPRVEAKCKFAEPAPRLKNWEWCALWKTEDDLEAKFPYEGSAPTDTTSPPIMVAPGVAGHTGVASLSPAASQGLTLIPRRPARGVDKGHVRHRAKRGTRPSGR